MASHFKINLDIYTSYGFSELHSIECSVSRFIGIDHVFLTENDPQAPTPRLRAQLQDFVSEGFLTLYTDTTAHNQPAAMRRCLKEQRANYDWLAFFDADEFLFVRDRCDAANSCQLRWIAP